MSLSPFDSFQSRFVTCLLNFPRTFESRPRAAALLAESLVILCSQSRNLWVVRSKVVTFNFVSLAAHRF